MQKYGTCVGGASNMHLVSWGGGTKGQDPNNTRAPGVMKHIFRISWGGGGGGRNRSGFCYLLLNGDSARHRSLKLRLEFMKHAEIIVHESGLIETY